MDGRRAHDPGHVVDPLGPSAPDFPQHGPRAGIGRGPFFLYILDEQFY